MAENLKAGFEPTLFELRTIKFI